MEIGKEKLKKDLRNNVTSKSLEIVVLLCRGVQSVKRMTRIMLMLSLVLQM